MRADTGKELNLSIVGGSGRLVRLRVLDEEQEAVSTAGMAFYGELRDVETDKAVGAVETSFTAEGDVLLAFPEMGVGKYVVVVEVSNDGGAVERFLSGYVSYMEAVSGVKPARALVPDRMIGVVMGDDVKRCLWYDTTTAELAAERAEEAALEVEEAAAEVEAMIDEAVAEATQRAEGAALRAEQAAERADASADRADEALDDCQQFMADWRVDIAGAIRPSFETGTWWVGNLNTGAPWRGQDGKSAKISETGAWLQWNDAAGYWENTGVMAAGEDGFSPYINSFGNWVVKLNGEEVDSGVLASGKDGKDGASVKRIIVDSYNEIPQEGETCNGGHYYYTPLGIRDVTLTTTTPSVILNAYEIDTLPEGTDLYINGIQFASIGQTLEGWVAALANDATLSALVTMEAVSDTELRISLQDGVSSVSLHLESNGKMHKAGSNFGMTDGYEIWAWVERRRYNGINWVYEGSWVCVGEANDIATAEIYGLVKLGTNSVINAGAPVGKNASGKMTVPIADTSAAGTAKLSTASSNLHASWRGAISKDTSDKLWAQHATYGRHGVVKLSRADAMGRVISIGLVPDGTVVDGTDRGGSIGCTLSELDTYGVVKSQYHITNGVNGIEYVVPVGMRMDATTGNGNHSDPWYHGANGVLMFNLLSDGALHWQTSGTITRDGVEVSTGGYLELRTSSSFSQSITGLSLKEATNSLLGGVYKATTLASGTSVPTCTAVLNYLNANYYTKSQTYTRDELTRSGGVIQTKFEEWMPEYLDQRLTAYATDAEVAATYATKAQLATTNSNLASVSNQVTALKETVDGLDLDDKYVGIGNSGIHELCVLTQEQFAALEVIDETKAYYILEA